MAGWYRQDLADDARLAMLLTLGQVELVLAHLRITEYRVRHEEDEPPEELAHWKPKLVELNLWRTLEELITVQLAQRARTNRSRRRDATSRDVTLHDVTTRDVTATQHNTTDSTPSPAEKEVARKTRKPRQPSKGKLALAEFNAAVTAVTGSPSCVTGMANETRAAAFADAIAAAGETMTDAVRRRHGLGKSLTLHWMMNDYAGDRIAKRPVNTGNHLRQPHPREIPTDPEAARVYWLGEQQDEPRFDFG